MNSRLFIVRSRMLEGAPNHAVPAILHNHAGLSEGTLQETKPVLPIGMLARQSENDRSDLIQEWKKAFGIAPDSDDRQLEARR